MADIIYTVNQDDPNNIAGFEQFSQTDKNLIGTFEVNSLFDSNKNTIELHILSLADDLLESIPGYTGYKLLGNAQSAGKEGASIVTVDPVEDCKTYGYESGGVKLLYHFVNDLYSKDKTSVSHFIESISPDRTELRITSLDLTSEEVISYTTTIKSRLADQSYFNEFRLNFGNNDLFIGTNIDTVDLNGQKSIVVKLYEPLPITYDIKSTFSIIETVSDSVAYEVDSIITLPPDTANVIRPANFNLEVVDEHVIPTQYFSYNDLFSYPVGNTNNQIYSLFNEKGIEISIDHSDYANFIQFSSAQERLMNFKYKLQLIESYSSSLAAVQSATSQSIGTTGSVSYFENLTQGVVSNFDHYERFLYYESSSNAWPKTNSTKPYTNAVSTTPAAISWYANQLTEATRFDSSNYNALINTIPTYLRDDENNDNYLIFVHMIAQHFDTIWLYTQAVTDKYDADNRLNYGIAKDLVGEALKNFGVKLYTSNKSIEDLFTTFIGQSYQSGSEVINHYITGSLTGSNTPIQPTSYDDYNKEVQKRIYHNLSYLLKTKGTERGLRALINCFGISSDILKIKQYGGRNTNERPFFGDYSYYTSSLDKIRLDNTGSLISGSTLSEYTSIVKRDDKYTDDLHAIEVGFSPTDSVDNYIKSNITGSFDIDDYIGDPGDLTSTTYSGLSQMANTLLSGSLGTDNHYDLQDYVRLIKFYDNTIFKMIKDFIPARVVADTGIVIKPNLLNRSKAKSVIVSGSRPEFSASIDTAFISGSNGNTFGIRDSYDTRYTQPVQTPIGLGIDSRHIEQQAKFDGEFSGSTITVSTRDLNLANIFKYPQYTDYPYNLHYWSSSVEVCILSSTTANIYIAPGDTINFFSYFPGNNINTHITASSTNLAETQLPSTWTVPALNAPFAQYETIYVTASNGVVNGDICSASLSMVYGICDISQNNNISTTVPTGYISNLSEWFNINPINTHLTYTLNGTTVPTANTASIVIPGVDGAVATVQVQDTSLNNCVSTVSLSIGSCAILARPYPNSISFTYSRTDTANFERDGTTNALGRGFKSFFIGTQASTRYTVYVLQVGQPPVIAISGVLPGNATKTVGQMISLAATALGLDYEPGYFPSFIVEAYTNNFSSCFQRVLVTPRPQPGCFLPGTKITKQDGSYKNIEDVEVGDVLLTYNTVTNTQEPGAVTYKKSLYRENTVTLYLSNGISIDTTIDHPFWTQQKGWCSLAPEQTEAVHGISASMLSIGDTLLTDSNTQVILEKIAIRDSIEQVYNISVDGNSTYYANSILTHNKLNPDNPINECFTGLNGESILCTDEEGNFTN